MNEVPLHRQLLLSSKYYPSCRRRANVVPVATVDMSSGCCKVVRVGEEAGGARGVGFNNAALNCKGAAVRWCGAQSKVAGWSNIDRVQGWIRYIEHTVRWHRA